MRYWTFDTNTCRFERASGQAALHSAEVTVINDGNDVQIMYSRTLPPRWPRRELLSVAGVEFEREQFE